MYVGAPACGMNAATRAFVRIALTHGYSVLGIHYGFEGLMNHDVSYKKIHLIRPPLILQRQPTPITVRRLTPPLSLYHVVHASRKVGGTKDFS